MEQPYLYGLPNFKTVGLKNQNMLHGWHVIRRMCVLHTVVFASVTLMSREWVKKHVKNMKRQNEKSSANPIASFFVKSGHGSGMC